MLESLFKTRDNPGSKFKKAKILLSSNMDTRIYLIFALTCLILFFYSIWEIKPVVVEISDFLGLLSHLPFAYWIGLIIGILLSIKLFLDNNIKNNYVYLVYLSVIGLFLFGVPVFAEDNARFPWSYYPSGEVNTILEKKVIDFDSEYPLTSYRSWPAIHLISATMIYITDIKLENLIKYAPLFWVISIILIIFCFGKYFGLPSNQSFMASFLFISSLWTPHYYYGPQSISYILYLLLFYFIVLFNINQFYPTQISLNKNNYFETIYYVIEIIRTRILICLTFTSLVITHLLTPIAIISSFIFSSYLIRTFKKSRVKFLIFFLILFIGWNAYFAPSVFETAVRDISDQAKRMDFFGFIKTEKYSPGSIFLRWIVHYSRLSYVVIYATTMVAAFVSLITGRIRSDKIENVKICFSWLFGILALFLLKYGGEMDDRAYLFALVPMIYIITCSFSKKLLIIIAALLITIHLPAHFGTESFDMTRTTELKGAKFFAEEIVDENKIYFSMWNTFINYYNPENVKLFQQAISVIGKPDTSTMDESTYLITSNGSHNFILYSFGFDPLEDWINNNQDKLTVLYENGYYQIYKNNE